MPGDVSFFYLLPHHTSVREVLQLLASLPEQSLDATAWYQGPATGSAASANQSIVNITVGYDMPTTRSLCLIVIYEIMSICL